MLRNRSSDRGAGGRDPDPTRDAGGAAGSGVRYTGVGSLPGSSVREAASLVTGEFPEFVFLPELPGRGPGADMIGRAASLLARVSDDFAVATTPTGWRFADAEGVDLRRAAAYWREDLEVFEEFCHTASGQVKVQVAGPITLAASIALVRGERALSDAGAVQDIVDAHREAVVLHAGDVQRRLPNAHVIVQIDEPSMDAALQGSLRTQSGWSRLRPLEEPQVRSWHRELASAITLAGATPWMHACAPHWPVELAHAAGYRGISGDMSLLADSDEDALAAAIEAGVTLVAGIIPSTDAHLQARPRSESAAIAPIRHRFQRIGLPDAVLASSVVITTTCGLGFTAQRAARIAIDRTREAARVLNDTLDV